MVDETPGTSGKAKGKAAARPRKSTPQPQSGEVVLLSGGNPQIAKGYGDAPVQAYIAAMPGWKSEVGRRLDALVARAVPGASKAVKWNTPLYGIEGQGWFLGFNCLTRYVKVAFFRGAARRCALSLPRSPGTRTYATSTSTSTTTSTRHSWPTGSGRPANCPESGCERPTPDQARPA